MKLPCLFVTLGLFAAAALPARAELTVEQRSLQENYREAPQTWKAERRWVWLLIAAGGGLAAGFGGFMLWRRRRAAPRRLLRAPFLLLVAAGGSPSHADACMNVERTTLEIAYADLTDSGWFNSTVRNALRADPSADPHVKANPGVYKNAPAPGELENDEAVRMVLRGAAPEALVKLKQIEERHPGLYATAANMGTVYELTGDDESALRWINEGIRRNPKSHMLAEWLHVNVLEAKIALKSDPAWLETHTITGLNPAANDFATLQGSKSRRQILESFRSQATVRALFIKPQDVILGHLLAEAAAFMMEEEPASVPGALDLAEEYGLTPAATASLRQRFGTWRKELVDRVGFKETGVWVTRFNFWLVFGMCALIGALLALRRCQVAASRE